ncbi:C-type lectin-containing protein [Akhmeta virus]|uniref:C-type lectin-containing protein n=1 Tax=Orthopoxvirus akhmetapox TaxID=2200830 RepID=A0A346FSJ1_9POXV|nr:C-type lectin-containing protein [Akhmeta virus]
MLFITRELVYRIVIVILSLSLLYSFLVICLMERRCEETRYKICPKNTIGINNICYYFSEDITNWTASSEYCKNMNGRLACIINDTYPKILRYRGTFDYWVGIYRTNSQSPWLNCDNKPYNNSIPVRGVEDYTYLNNNGISSATIYADRRWICEVPMVDY